MIIFPPAKINLGLHVLNKREDGYHNIETCMLSIPVFDVLEILPSKEFDLKLTGTSINGELEQNLCFKAFQLMREKYRIPNVYMHLRKCIPMGAGLGGGSSDCAYVLKGLNQLFELDLDSKTLKELAQELGSDCPFFIDEGFQFAEGRGEILSKGELDLDGYYLKLVYNGIHVNTSLAYRELILSGKKLDISLLSINRVSTWRESLSNDFESSVFGLNPELAKIKESLYDEGALYSAMSGSGSAVFGIFQNEPKASGDYLYEKVIRL